MKTTMQAIASLLSLAGLLGGVGHAQATNIAELPLKASVLAKPNVVFGMDDSGSMDWEVLLDTNSGLVFWDYTTAWNSTTGKPLSYTDKVPYAYLIPVGTATGGQIYAYNSWYGQSLPPTTQFAWLRSARFNPIYYDSNVTYKPWSPAYLSGGSVTNFADATPSAAKSHPASSSSPTLDLSVSRDASSTNFSSNGWMFYVQGGMVLPTGTYVKASSTTSGICSGSTWRTLTAATTVATGSTCWAAIPYHPATFWHAETCTPDGSTCLTGPDGTTTIKRYEIKSSVTSYPSGRTYTAELQNFANWFSYHRKRKLMLAGSMGAVLENITGLRMGVVPFNNRTTITMHDADATSVSANRFAVAGKFYLNSMSSNGTPTLQTMNHIGGQYGSDTNIIQYACQRNAQFIVTDGFANDSGITPPAYDASVYGSGAPYQTTTASTQSDIALSYFTNRLRASGGSALAAGKVPAGNPTVSNPDTNTNLHVNTYAITLGVRGALWPNTVDPFVTAPAWTAPVLDDPSMIDDLWHATINGRGQMYLATTPDETAASIRSGLQDILSQTGAQGGIAVSTVNLQRGDQRAYFGTYNPSGWTGDLTANEIDPGTAVVSTTPTWSAGAQLVARDWTTRVIASHDGTSGVPFTEAAVGSLVNPGSTWGTTSELMDYLRGDRSLEGTTFRTRTGLMGAVINSEPTVSREDGVVYVASGEGMLHAFDTQGSSPGAELWAFVPRAVLPDIGQTSARSYAFKTQLDGSPVVGKTGTGSRLLVAGLGAAGRYYYAIDVSSPRGLNEATLATKVKWEFPTQADTTTQSKVGQTLGRPLIVKVAGGGYTVVVSSGYNNVADGKGRVWMLDPASGAIQHEFVTTDGSLGAESGLTHLSPFVENTGEVQYVYGGDLLGNVWRFDLVNKGAVHKVATLKDDYGNLQPVTAAPELLAYKGQRIVVVGTGRLLDITDFGSTAVQTMYGIADGTTLADARASLVEQTYTRATETITDNEVDWSTDRGWYLDLPAGELANTRPTIAYGAVAFTTNINGGSDCSASSYLYVLDVTDGGKYGGASFVSSLISATANSSGVNALLTADGSSGSEPT
ncbi:MAG TPA: PilC/PilY family type IV pilus protein, partial [Rubrivivax sp.]|nr:PilC/PilY family type IV pilus protein [Rubrivivax sp.]